MYPQKRDSNLINLNRSYYINSQYYQKSTYRRRYINNQKGIYSYSQPPVISKKSSKSNITESTHQIDTENRPKKYLKQKNIISSK